MEDKKAPKDEKLDDKLIKQFDKLKEGYEAKVKPTVKKNIGTVKETYKDVVKPKLEENIEKAKVTYNEKVQPQLKTTFKHSKKAMSNMDVYNEIKKNFWRELFTNGLSLLLAFSVAKSVSYFFVVNGWDNLFGFGGNQGKIAVSEGTLEFISFLAEFIVGLFVFTFVEKFIENFIEVYSEDKRQDDLEEAMEKEAEKSENLKEE